MLTQRPAECSTRSPLGILGNAPIRPKWHATIESILSCATWTPEGADELGGEETEPAYVALVRDEFDGDIVNGLIRLRFEPFTFPCDDGTLRMERER
jgi:hypothetical protein